MIILSSLKNLYSRKSMAKLNISEEERKKRSERMKALHAEGKAGAAYGKMGGRPRKKRASELVAEKVAEEAEVLWNNLRKLALESESEKVQADVTFKLLEIEERERKIVVEEEVRYEQLKHGELAELVIGNLFELVQSGQIDLGDIIEAEIVEPRAIDPASEIDGSAEETSESDGATD